jgi:hypothetical protein
VVTHRLRPEDDVLLSFNSLGHRWDCSSQSAEKRALELGIPILQFNSRVSGVRLNDVLRAEERMVKIP